MYGPMVEIATVGNTHMSGALEACVFLYIQEVVPLSP